MRRGRRKRFYYPYGFEPFLFIEDCFWLVFIGFPNAVMEAVCGIMMLAFTSGISYLIIRFFIWIVGKIIQHIM